MARFSILVPSYNHARFLGESLASLRAQTFRDWEAVLIDDGSSDDSVAVALAFAAEEPRLRVLANERNLGTYGTQQRALDLTSSEWVAVLNSDDIWSPEKLEFQMQAIESAFDLSACYTLGDAIDETGRPLGDIDDPPPSLLEENRVLASSVVFRRKGLAFHSDLRYSGDWVALLEAGSRGRVVRVSERLAFWRQHAHNSYRRSAGQVNEEIRVREAILAADWPSAERRSLAACARHLAALYVLVGERAAARRAAVRAARLAPALASLRRASVVALHDAHARLWPNEPALPFQPSAPLTLSLGSGQGERSRA